MENLKDYVTSKDAWKRDYDQTIKDITTRFKSADSIDLCAHSLVGCGSLEILLSFALGSPTMYFAGMGGALASMVLSDAREIKAGRKPMPWLKDWYDDE